jgi:FSR family fosmidomycin resistance protein-like MFS transporter
MLAIAHAVTDIPQGALLVALPYFKAKFALSYTQVSLIILLQSISSSLVQPVFGYFSDRISQPWLMPLGCIVSGAAMFASLWAPNYDLLLFFTLISGLGVAAFHPEGAKMANRLSGPAKGKGVSLFVVGGSAGMAIGSLFLGVLLADGPSAKLFLFVLPSLLMAIPLFKLAAEVPLRASSGLTATTGDIRGLLSASLAALLGVVVTRATVSSGLSTFIPLYYVSFLQGDPLYASSLLTVYLASGALGTLAGGALSDRFGSRKIMIWSITPMPIIIILFQLSSTVWVFPVLAVASMLMSAAHSSSLILAQGMMPGNVGMASGLTLGFSFGIGALGVLALGRVADIWTLPLVFDILAVLPLVCLVLTLFVRDSAKASVVQLADK